MKTIVAAALIFGTSTLGALAQSNQQSGQLQQTNNVAPWGEALGPGDLQLMEFVDGVAIEVAAVGVCDAEQSRFMWVCADLAMMNWSEVGGERNFRWSLRKEDYVKKYLVQRSQLLYSQNIEAQKKGQFSCEQVLEVAKQSPMHKLCSRER